MNHTKAFQCHECPRNADPERGPSCPAWWEYVATEIASGREEIRRECGWQAMPRFFVEVIRASNRPAAAVEDTRNQIVAGFAEVAGRLSSGFAALSQGAKTPKALPAAPFPSLEVD